MPLFQFHTHMPFLKPNYNNHNAQSNREMRQGDGVVEDGYRDALSDRLRWLHDEWRCVKANQWVPVILIHKAKRQEFLLGDRKKKFMHYNYCKFYGYVLF